MARHGTTNTRSLIHYSNQQPMLAGLNRLRQLDIHLHPPVLIYFRG